MLGDVLVANLLLRFQRASLRGFYRDADRCNYLSLVNAKAFELF